MFRTSRCVQKCTPDIRKDASSMQTSIGFFSTKPSQPLILRCHSEPHGNVQNIPQGGGDGWGDWGKSCRSKQKSVCQQVRGRYRRAIFAPRDRLRACGECEFWRETSDGPNSPASRPAGALLPGGRISPMAGKWRPRRDLNPCRRRERPVSWARLDDGDARVTTAANRAFFVLQQRVFSKK